MVVSMLLLFLLGFLMYILHIGSDSHSKKEVLLLQFGLLLNYPDIQPVLGNPVVQEDLAVKVDLEDPVHQSDLDLPVVHVDPVDLLDPVNLLDHLKMDQSAPVDPVDQYILGNRVEPDLDNPVDPDLRLDLATPEDPGNLVRPEVQLDQ